MALSFCIVVAFVIHGFGPVSGAHIKAAVTIRLAATGRFPWRKVPTYVVAQLGGAAVGGLLVVAVYGSGAVDQGLGGTVLADGVSFGRGMLIEALGTFLLMITIMAVAVDSRAPLGWPGFLIGLTVVCEILLVGPLTGGSVDPARTFGSDVVTALFGGAAAWSQLVVHWVGPLVRAGVAAVVYDLVAQSRAAETADEDAFTPTNDAGA